MKVHTRGMCGIAGFVGGDWSAAAQVKSTIERMNRRLRHRGPDQCATWLDADAKVAFAHNRLSIIDLTTAGNQPMTSSSSRFVIIYNGEIYNHSEMRAELCQAGHAGNWNGHSDTETLLAAIETFGVRGAVDRAAGMFAFALWDRSDRSLILGRDRIGEKPLYYGRSGDGAFLFGSELKALTQHARFRPEVDRQALGLLLRYGYVPAPFSIYQGIAKLPAGMLLTLAPGSAEPKLEQYWSVSGAAHVGLSDPLDVSAEEAVGELERVLELAIRQQMIADVPLGAFLSGGVDSSTVVALMQRLSTRPVKTFTIGFEEPGYDEARHAKAVAQHLGTDHTELYVTPEEAREVIPRLSEIYDEPFADSSQIPTHLIASLARKQITVALSGDGGDEMFGGYNRYLLTSEIWDKIARTPLVIRSVTARALTAISPSAWTKFGDAAGTILPAWAQFDRLGDKIHKGAPLLTSGSGGDLYSGMVSLWGDPQTLVLGADEFQVANDAVEAPFREFGLVEQMMASDALRYLPDDILVKVDRAAMAVSLETRVPFVDHRVVEFAWRLPKNLKIRNGTTKWILRELLYRYVPCELIERPKMGFAVPIATWLRGPLREWAEAMLDENRLRSEGYLRPEPIRRAWEAHLSGHADHHTRLWVVLMFQCWLEANRDLPRLISTDLSAHPMERAVAL